MSAKGGGRFALHSLISRGKRHVFFRRSDIFPDPLKKKKEGASPIVAGEGFITTITSTTSQKKRHRALKAI